MKQILFNKLKTESTSSCRWKKLYKLYNTTKDLATKKGYVSRAFSSFDNSSRNESPSVLRDSARRAWTFLRLETRSRAFDNSGTRGAKRIREKKHSVACGIRLWASVGIFLLWNSRNSPTEKRVNSKAIFWEKKSRSFVCFRRFSRMSLDSFIKSYLSLFSFCSFSLWYFKRRVNFLVFHLLRSSQILVKKSPLWWRD